MTLLIKCLRQNSICDYNDTCDDLKNDADDGGDNNDILKRIVFIILLNTFFVHSLTHHLFFVTNLIQNIITFSLI